MREPEGPVPLLSKSPLDVVKKVGSKGHGLGSSRLFFALRQYSVYSSPNRERDNINKDRGKGFTLFG